MNKLERELEEIKEKLAEKQREYEAKCRSIEEKYGSDCLALLKGEVPEQPVIIVRKVISISRDDGNSLSTLTEEYIKKRDNSLVLLRVISGKAVPSSPLPITNSVRSHLVITYIS